MRPDACCSRPTSSRSWDQQSAELALQLCPEREPAVTDDLAFLLPRLLPAPPPRSSQAISGKVLGVSLLAYSAMTLGEKSNGHCPATEILGEALNDILGCYRDWSVVLFEFFSGSASYGDATVLRTLQSRIHFADRVSYCSYQGDFRRVYQELSRCDALLGMRFHSCLLAYLLGLLFLMIDYHPKCMSLASRLELPERAVMPLTELTEAGPLIEAPERFRSSVPSSSRTAESLGNMALLADWLRTRGRDSCGSGPWFTLEDRLEIDSGRSIWIGQEVAFWLRAEHRLSVPTLSKRCSNGAREFEWWMI
jgi:hypothetical protein